MKEVSRRVYKYKNNKQEIDVQYTDIKETKKTQNKAEEIVQFLK